MSRATISTGGIDFPLHDTERKPGGEAAAAMHIAILADFSGRQSRAQGGGQSAATKPIEINRDNFDEVFAQLDVQLQLPVSDQALAFNEFDDLHPDFIYARVSLFDKMRILKRQLSKPDKFEQAAAEITAWANYRDKQGAAPQAAGGLAPPENLLDAVLQQRGLEERWQAGPGGHIDKLIKDIVSPFVEAGTDPRQADMQQAVDEATSDLMRKIMHHSLFQRLEASWRSLYLLIRRLESTPDIKLFLFDISRDEIKADLDNGKAIEASALFKLLVESRRTAGATPFSLIVGDYSIGDDEADIGLAAAMAQIARATNATWLSGGSERLAGCSSIGTQPDVDDWDYQPDQPSLQAWQQLRSAAPAAHLALAAPRFMLRLPYGRKTSSMENFAYEELSAQDSHSYYLWGNSAFLVALLLGQAYQRYGWQLRPGQLQEVDNLPLHVYQSDGETHTKPCAEVLLTDRAAGRLQQAGLLPVRSISARDAVVIAEFCSAAATPTPVRGPWPA